MKCVLSNQPPASGSSDPIGKLSCLFVSLWDGQVRGSGLYVGVSPAHHCGPFAWRVRLAGWLRRATRAYLDEFKRHHKEMILDDYTDKIQQLDGRKQQALAKLKECLAK